MTTIFAITKPIPININAKNKNPAVEPETGDIFIKIGKDKYSGDQIGNIQDFLFE
ncbi:MAG: hypothetical protein V7L00_16940 [Nostoc sp.]|uniref:hypothetical protein n=1 Tax=unclassified Nostoc TaxID=2593658 RepID=UPI0025F4B377|nr:hypothetical protein [Nostoc sp. JL33]MBN3874116.1 hypothetical protein [Nostoc sp. JL33]